MGTETMNWLATLLPLTLNTVKLNNPQMGTETSVNEQKHLSPIMMGC